jgi:hypothetical protein
MMNRRGWLGLMLLGMAVFLVLGCNPTDKKSGDQAKAASTGDDHGWWCEEHGIPEEECGLCNKAYRDKKKAEGDWCPEHRRLKSQCFKCDPTLYEKVFEPKYVAKYGKKPPRPPESEFTK